MRRCGLRIGLAITVVSLSVLLAAHTSLAQNCDGLATLDCTIAAQRHPKCGCWEHVMTDWPSESIHAALVTTGTYPNITGKVLMFDRGAQANRSTTVRTALWDPQCGTSSPQCFQIVPLTLPENLTIYCAGHSFLADGKLLVTGGSYLRIAADPQGTSTNYWFDPFAAGTVQDPYWKQRADLNSPVCVPPTCTRVVQGGRYYPTNLSLDLPGFPDSVLTFSGLNKNTTVCYNEINDTVERYDRVETTTNPLGKWDIISTNAPTDRREAPLTYPRLHLFPSPDPSTYPAGLIFQSGGDPETHLYDPASGLWTNMAPSRCARASGTSTMLPMPLDAMGDIPYSYASVLIAGGLNLSKTANCAAGFQNTADLYISYDITAGYDRWVPTANNMSKARHHGSTVILPDGNIIYVGGEELPCIPEQSCEGYGGLCKPVFEADLFNPPTITWSQIPPPPPGERRPRQYHSVGLLLPDGSVFMAGGESASPRCYPTASAQIYRPGYFFRGARPVIQSAPALMNYNNSEGSRRFTLNVTLPQGDNIAQIQKVLLIRPSSVTHSLNTDQRSLELNITDRSGVNCHLASSNCTVTVSTPLAPYIAPRGYYMLFVVKGTDDNQIPSVAKFVQLLP